MALFLGYVPVIIQVIIKGLLINHEQMEDFLYTHLYRACTIVHHWIRNMARAVRYKERVIAN
jgi:hypothetical protein